MRHDRSYWTTSGPVPITTATSRPGKYGLLATSLEIRTSYQAHTEHTQIRPGIRVVDCGRNTASYQSGYWEIGERYAEQCPAVSEHDNKQEPGRTDAGSNIAT